MRNINFFASQDQSTKVGTSDGDLSTDLTTPEPSKAIEDEYK